MPHSNPAPCRLWRDGETLRTTPVGPTKQDAANLEKYWHLRSKKKEINALDIRSARGLTKVGPAHFIYGGKAVIIKRNQDPYGQEWERLDALLSWPQQEKIYKARCIASANAVTSKCV